MKKHFNKIQLTLYFLMEVRGMQICQGNTIHTEMVNAMEWYEKNLPEWVFTEKEKILNKHGFTKESWEEEMFNSLSIFFNPTPESQQCNREMRELFGKLPLLNSANYYLNYTYAMLNKYTKARSILRVKQYGIWLYYNHESINQAIKEYIQLIHS